MKSQNQAQNEQADLINKGMNLGWWFGTNCKKCHGVYPKIMNEGNTTNERVYFICEVCGKRTEGFQMPWIAEKEWNAGKFKQEQIRMW